MDFIDTSSLIDRVTSGKPVNESISVVTEIEYPLILEYENFTGKVVYPDLSDFMLALELQMRLKSIGRMKNAADLIIAATCLNRNELLVINDGDFSDIEKVSDKVFLKRADL